MWFPGYIDRVILWAFALAAVGIFAVLATAVWLVSRIVDWAA